MSHFTVLVTRTNLKSVDEQLAPFDENLEKPLHIRRTKAQLIEEAREDIQRYKKMYDRWQADKAAYEADCTNPRHLSWLRYEVPGLVEILEKNDENALYEHGIKWLEADDLDEDGNEVSTSNEDAQWDWYQVGGRWSGNFVKKAGAEGEIGTPGVMMEQVTDPTLADVIKVGDIDWDAMDAVTKKERAERWDKARTKDGEHMLNWDEQLKLGRDEYIALPIDHATFAVLHDGQWYERGSMGWWGIVKDEKDGEVWAKEFRKLIDGLDVDDEVTLVDCHI